MESEAPPWFCERFDKLAEAMNLIMESTADVDLPDEVMKINAAITNFGPADVAGADFAVKVLRPIRGVFDAFMNSAECDPDFNIIYDASNLLDDVLEKK